LFDLETLEIIKPFEPFHSRGLNSMSGPNFFSPFTDL
jgi:hypothetical protein